MRVIKNENPVPIDVDDTLILHSPPEGHEDDYVLVEDPYSEEEVKVKVWPHRPHIQILKDKKARRSFIMVWSQSGVLWAEAVIKALELEKYVDLVLGKSKEYMDDLPANEWMGNRIYLPYDSKYKSQTLDSNKK